MGWSAEGIVNCMCVRGKRGGCERGGGALLESYIQLKPGPGFSLETCTFERRGEGGEHRALRDLCYIQFEHFPFKQFMSVWQIRVLNMTGIQKLPIDTARCKRKEAGCKQSAHVECLKLAFRLN